MISELLKNNPSDAEFDIIFPASEQALSKVHWTPVKVALKAADWLVQKPGTKVLDIGSGAGKFCLIGAASTQGKFTGVEKREFLVETAQGLAWMHELENARFLHQDVVQVDFKDYEAFYFFNPFYEYISPYAKIDTTYPLDKKIFKMYLKYVGGQFSAMPVGTRVAAYGHNSLTMPDEYVLVETVYELELQLWEKRN